MMPRRVPDEDIRITLACLRIRYGIGWTFAAIEDYMPVHAALFPVETQKLAEDAEKSGGHDLRKTIGGQLWEYWNANGRDDGSGLTKVGEARYRLEAAPDRED